MAPRRERTDTEESGLGTRQNPVVAVDLVLLTVRCGALQALLMRRDRAPDEGKWALPGGFVRIDETLEDAVIRVLREKVRLDGIFFEQLYSFGALGRDPRGRVVSIAYYALVDAAQFDRAAAASALLAPFALIVPWEGQRAAPIRISSADGKSAPLALDHAEILGVAVARLRGKLDYSPVGFELLPELFTLRQLQVVHEAILGTKLNKPAFRRRMLDKGVLKATGKFETGVAYRPAELYRFVQKSLPANKEKE